MTRPYCGQKLTTCDERFTLIHMTQDDFDASVSEAYQRGQEDMRKRAARACYHLSEIRPAGDAWISACEAAERNIRSLKVKLLSECAKSESFRPVCQCGSAKRGLACKMDCPGSEVTP